MSHKLPPRKFEEETKAPPQAATLPDFMLSQESIKHLEDQAEAETKEERHKLDSLEKLKREFVSMLRTKQDIKHHNTAGDKQERLKQLLRQTELFTQFLLQNSGSRKGLELKAIEAKQQKDTIGGKTSVGRRHLKKTAKAHIEEDDNSDQDQILTRLDAQPSLLKGGLLRDYQLDGLNWLIGLYETGINGILADEMVSFKINNVCRDQGKLFRQYH